MILPGSYANGFAPRDGTPLYPELWRGCVGAWNPGLGPSGLTLRDWSPYKNHGTLTNMDTGTDWVAIAGRYALDFDGANDYVRANFNNPASAEKTLSCWFNSRSTTALQFLANCNDSILLRLQSGKLIGYVYPFVFLTGTTSYAADTWYHASVVATASTLTLYLNGNVEVSQSRSGNVQASASMFIGSTILDLTSYCLNGLCDDVLLYNRALASREIKTLASRPGIAYELAPRRRSRVSVLASLRYNIFTGNVGSLEVIGAS